MIDYFKMDYHIAGYEHLSEQDVVQQVRTLLHTLPRGRARRLVVGMCDEFEISHNELQIEYGALACCSCYGCPPMILDNERSQESVEPTSYFISGSSK